MMTKCTALQYPTQHVVACESGTTRMHLLAGQIIKYGH